MTIMAAIICAGAGVAALPERMEWEIVDVAQQRTFAVTDQADKLAQGGQLEASPAGSEIRLGVRYEPGESGTRIAVRLADQSGRDRGLMVRLSLVSSGEGDWRWGRDLDAAVPLGDKPLSSTTALRGLPGLPYFEEAERPDYGQYSTYPLGVIQRGGDWQALARPLSELALVRFSGVGGDEARLVAEVDLALSEYTDPPREAEFELWFLQDEGADGAMREALGRYYEVRPEDWEVRTPMFGGWMPFTDLAKLPNVDEFGFAFQEGGRSPAFVDVLGALSFVYFHCAGEFANVDGYERGSQPLPPYETVVAAFNAVAKRRTGLDEAWDVCGIRNADGKIEYRPERVYGDFFCQACVDPEVPYGKAMADRLTARVTAQPAPKDIDGVYYDGIAAGLDYAPEHLRAADHLLLWDGKLGRPVNYNLWSSAEWARYIHEGLAGQGKLTMLNDSSLASFPFVGPWIDVQGGEMSIFLRREQARLIRTLARHRPFCTLVKADFSQFTSAHIETYMRRCVAYGILPGFFDITPSGAHPGSSYWLHPEWYDRDRPLFRRYMPLARELARAGWEPRTLARPRAEGVFVERFGPRDEAGLAYLAVSTDPREKSEETHPVSLALGAELLQGGGPALAAELLTGRVEPASAELKTELTGEGLAVWAIGSSEAQAKACVARAHDVLQRRAQYIEACRAGGQALAPWQPYGDGGAKIAAPGRDAGHCLQAEKAKPGAAGATQTVTVNHKEPRKLLVSAWSRAENVSGQASRDYAIYVDCYYTDGSAIHGQTIDFATGTHDWQRGERTIEPEKPIRNINVYLLFRGGHTGQVWFDDVHVALAEEPETNLLSRGDFETGEARPLAEETPEAKAINYLFGELAKVLADLEEGREHKARAAQMIVDEIEEEAGKTNWEADRERMLRDVGDLRWHLALAEACRAGKPQPAQRASRLTELAVLGTPRVSTGPKQYRATTGKMPSGTIVRVDSNYPEYTPEVLTDGQINPEAAHWTKVAWASGEGAGPHWVELELPRPMKVGELRIWWGKDAGTLHVSEKIEAQRKEGDKWVRIKGQKTRQGDKAALTIIELSGTQTKMLRLYQPPHGGPPDRPGLMWVSEIEVEAR